MTSEDENQDTIPSDFPVPTDSLEVTRSVPTQIGSFRVERLLGEGSFGAVYLAFDPQLQRQVAIKVPHPEIVRHAESRELYLKEAQVVAKLDHPNIVPVYEVGRSPEHPVYVVSKFIQGNDLALQLKKSPPSFDQSVFWMIDLADAMLLKRLQPSSTLQTQSLVESIKNVRRGGGLPQDRKLLIVSSNNGCLLIPNRRAKSSWNIRRRRVRSLGPLSRATSWKTLRRTGLLARPSFTLNRLRLLRTGQETHPTIPPTNASCPTTGNSRALPRYRRRSPSLVRS